MAYVLVVEDDPSVLEATKIILEDSGHVVDTAENGFTAMERLEARDFDLVVTDILMPEKDGIELLQDIARNWPDLKVIAFSGGGQRRPVSYQKISRSFGASAFIHKPFTKTELVGHVNEVLSTA